MPVPTDDTAKPAAPKDWASAIEAGRQAEIDNIAMYDRFLAQTLPADVRQVFEQLKAASQNHLRAFTSNGGRV
jgi:rubrerythrin